VLASLCSCLRSTRITRSPFVWDDRPLKPLPRLISQLKLVLVALSHFLPTTVLQKFKIEFENDKDSEGLDNVEYQGHIKDLHKAVEEITRFFTSQIRYLGPLRADPQASQKFAPSSELDDVGAKGEYAAAVYDANQKARIDWYNPSSQQVEQGTLKVALDSWARYLGVAHQIKIETAGQSGFSWQVVHLAGQKPLPLTAVGVGVSQILPILVMGLLAPSDTLLIVEQPELHLHPRVQARLGDFFVGLSKCKKQCLIETHSENLVNQLRYHIAQAGGQDKSDCMIYFVDQDEKGAARFEPVEISAKGNILNWPEGFFDETMQQEDRITAESIKRRANVANSGYYFSRPCARYYT
jgi:predicted ATPase